MYLYSGIRACLPVQRIFVGLFYRVQLFSFLNGFVQCVKHHVGYFPVKGLFHFFFGFKNLIVAHMLVNPNANCHNGNNESCKWYRMVLLMMLGIEERDAAKKAGQDCGAYGIGTYAGYKRKEHGQYGDDKPYNAERFWVAGKLNI